MSARVYAATNFGIFMGYWWVAAYVIPRVALQAMSTRVSAVVFFLTCGLTHLEHAAHAFARRPVAVADMGSWHMLGIHVVQVGAVTIFFRGLYREVVNVPQGTWTKTLRVRRAYDGSERRKRERRKL